MAPCVAQLQALQAEYLGDLSAIYDKARTRYYASNVTKHTLEVKYLPQFITLENSLQDQVNGLLFSLQVKLIASGYSTQKVMVLRGDYQQAVAQAMAKFK